MPRYRTAFTAITDPFTAKDEADARMKMLALASVWFRSHDDVLPLLADLDFQVQEVAENADKLV